jgi:hypothetical protein
MFKSVFHLQIFLFEFDNKFNTENHKNKPSQGEGL